MSMNGVKMPLVHQPGLGGSPARDKLPCMVWPDYVVLRNDFVKAADYNTVDMTMTKVDGDTDNAEVNAVDTTLAKGYLKITTNNKDNDSNAIQWTSNSFSLVSGKRTWFEAIFNVDNADDCDFMIGLHSTDTTPLDAAAAVCFRITEGSALIYCEAEKAGSARASVSSAVSAVDATDIKVAFEYDGSVIRYYINGSLVSTQSTAAKIPTAAMSVGVMMRNGGAAAQTAYVDYVSVVQER